MLELLRLMPPRVRAISTAFGVLILFVQICVLAIHTIRQYEPESPAALGGYMLYTYSEMAPALPMVLVVTVGSVVLMQVSAAFVRSGPTILETPKWIRVHPVKAGLIIVPMLGILVSWFVFSLGIVAGLLLSFLLGQVFGLWMDWVISWGRTEE